MKFQIGPWQANTTTNEISNGATSRRLEARAMDVLKTLHDQRGEVVSKDELITAVWKRHAVSDHAVTVVISDLRNALGDDSRDPEFIQTVPKRGYRLVTGAGAGATLAKSEIKSGARLRIPTIAGALVLIAVLTTLAGLSRSLFTPAPASVATLVVMDAVNVSSLSSFDALANGLTAVTLDAAVSADAVVIRWRGEATGPAPAGDWVLQTQIVESEAGPASFIQLAEGGSGAISWTSSALISPDRFAATQKALVDEALQTIGMKTKRAASGLAASAVDDLYWKARLFWDLRDAQAALQARALLLEAVEIEPDFARGHAALADLYAHKTGAYFADVVDDPASEAKKQLQIAEALSPALFETRIAAAHVAFFVDADANRASELLSALTVEKPSHVIAKRSLAAALAASGDMEGAIRAIEAASALDPLNITTAWDKVWIYYVARRHDEAFAAIEDAETLGGNGDLYRGLIYAEKGDRAQAVLTLSKVVGRATGRALRGGAGYDEIFAALTPGAQTAQDRILRASLAALAGDEKSVHEIFESAPPETRVWARLWLAQAPVFARVEPASSAPRQGARAPR